MDKFHQINTLFNTGLEQLRATIYTLSKNELIDEDDRKHLQGHLKWLTEVPLSSFDYDWEKEKASIVFTDDALDKAARKKIQDRIDDICQFVYNYILGKYLQKGAYRASGHFIDQKLNQGKIAKQQDANLPGTQQTIDFKLHRHDFTNIRLSPPEEKLIRSILMLLHLNSNLNFESEDYYSGNGDLMLAEEGFRLPHLRIRPIDLYKAYTGKSVAKNISGAEIQHIKKVLFDLEKQQFEVTYRRVVKKQVGKQEVERVQLVSMNKPLFKVISFMEISGDEERRMEEGDASVRTLREELILALNPIFIDQIKTKYVEFPMDITHRIEQAAGGAKKVSETMNLLVDYLLREKSSKRYEAEIEYEHLARTLGLTRLLERGERARARQKVEEAFGIATKIGILEQWQQVDGAKMQSKIRFHINPNFK